MKKTLLLIVALVFTISGNVVRGSDATLSASLLGRWDCSSSTFEDGINSTSEFAQYYIRNGRSTSVGELVITSLSDGLVLAYIFSATGDWEISDGFLLETLTDFKSTSLDPSADEIFNLQDLIPDGVSDSSKIAFLSEKEFVAVSESDGTQVFCFRHEKTQ